MSHISLSVRFQLLNRVAGANYLTQLDMKQAYLQIEMDPQNRTYTSFQSPFGTSR